MKLTKPRHSFATVVCVAVSTLLIADSFACAAGPPTIVTLGDSITKGVRTGVAADETFASLLKVSLIKMGVKAKVVNVGIGGERTDQALKRLDKDVIAKLPTLVTIMYGTNDSYVDKGKKVSRVSIDDYRKNLRELVTRLRKAKITPVLMTEPCWGNKAGSNGLGEHPNIRLAKYMNVCRLVAKDMKVPLVDNYRIWSDVSNKGTDVGTWTTDQCHPNATGHRKITETMLPVVRKALSKKEKAVTKVPRKKVS